MFALIPSYATNEKNEGEQKVPQIISAEIRRGDQKKIGEGRGRMRDTFPFEANKGQKTFFSLLLPHKRIWPGRMWRGGENNPELCLSFIPRPPPPPSGNPPPFLHFLVLSHLPRFFFSDPTAAAAFEDFVLFGVSAAAAAAALRSVAAAAATDLLLPLDAVGFWS